MDEIVLTTQSTLRSIFVEALLEYSNNLLNGNKQELPPQGSKKLHSIIEVAEYLQVSTTTAQKYKNEGMPCIQYGRKVIFDTVEIMEWLNNPKKKGVKNAK
ncbi:MAG: helix-turn-helix domain-containing protein [Salinivirgaceae bacterium]|jgi:hypothetical protein